MIVSVPMPHGDRAVEMAGFRTLSMAAVLRLAEVSSLDPLQQLPVFAAVVRDSLMDPTDWAEVEGLNVDDFAAFLGAWMSASEAAS